MNLCGSETGMKRLAFLLAALMLLSAMCVSVGALTGDNYVWFADTDQDALPKNEHIGGDTDGDGKVNLRDVIGLLRYLGGIRTCVTRDAVDVNGDGTVDIRDVLWLLQYTVGNHDRLGKLTPGDNG